MSDHSHHFIRPEILAAGGYSPGEQPLSTEIIKLNTNEHPYRASEKVFEAVIGVLEQGLSRYPDPSASEFCHEASKLYGVPSDWILCGNGSDDILSIIMRAFVGPGNRIRLPYPCYFLYKTLAELQGALLEMVRYEKDWSLPSVFTDDVVPPHRLHASATACALASEGRLKLAFLPNPTSPSGLMIAPEQVLELAQRLPCPLVVDEAYADFAGTNCIGLVERCEKIIISRTLSKSYALAGLRFGFLIARPEIIRQLGKVKNVYDCDSISIAAASAAIRDQDWLKIYTGKILATRNRLTAEMRRMGFHVTESHANFIWNTHPEISLPSIYTYLRKNGILLRYFDYPGWGDGLRISVGTDEQIDRCLQLIEEECDRLR